MEAVIELYEDEKYDEMNKLLQEMDIVYHPALYEIVLSVTDEHVIDDIVAIMEDADEYIDFLTEIFESSHEEREEKAYDYIYDNYYEDYEKSLKEND